MAKFTYNNAKNANIGHTSFALICGYHFWVFVDKDTNPYLQSKSADELSVELRDLITVCQKKLPPCSKTSEANLQ